MLWKACWIPIRIWIRNYRVRVQTRPDTKKIHNTAFTGSSTFSWVGEESPGLVSVVSMVLLEQMDGRSRRWIWQQDHMFFAALCRSLDLSAWMVRLQWPW